MIVNSVIHLKFHCLGMISFLNLVTSGASQIVYFISILIESRTLNRVRYYNRLHLIS
jgi:hypothetical protein